MVEISEVIQEETPQQQHPPPAEKDPVDSRSQERLADADEIEAALLAHITRPSAQLHLQNLIAKLRKEGKALQRVAAATTSAAAAGSDSAASPSAAAVAMPAAAAALPTPPKKTPITTPIITSTTNKYQSFPTHYFDCGAYNSPTLTVYVPLTNIGSHDPSKISCNFTSSSFDLIVTDYIIDGKSYRLLNDNLEHDIDVSKSKYIVKGNKIIIKLGKVKGEYGSYDSWTELTAKKKKKKDKGKKDDPAAGIMDLMKDMYDNGDDTMKKMIGETMLKQRTGQLDKKDPMTGGMGGMGDMGIGDMDI